ncbi:2OG-Fe oxygenase superfamily protein [Botryosphaeria dothidea]|uniref:2OG-Fe oxygenase superfamily protein n=1 Tax=Botryosphaeria dothidea TaxID=55169 RepID=A0A8H4N6Q8_9PEZI|nr:2OG-Fe oxygenase superfamily protein [Botryosphaeria dothidea]
MTTQVETVRTSPELPRYIQVPETKYELDWADLATLDLSQYDTPGGRQKLAAQLFDAIQNVGFFYVTNFGLSQEEVDRQFAIGKELFKIPMEEKLKYRANLEEGGYNGYKPLGLREIRPGKFDNTEIYNIPKFIPAYEQEHPEIIKQNRPEIERFARRIFDEIVKKLLVLLAIVLELPEDYFLERHRYEDKSDCHLRYMKYHKRSAQENAELENVWVKGHTDFGSLTLLFRQPVASLQVRTPSGEWKYVKPHPASITVNLADYLDFVTNGFLKSSIHRVVAPPPDQTDVDRHGVLYFVRPTDDTELRVVQSEVLEKLGYDQIKDKAAVGIMAGQWVKGRVKTNVMKVPEKGKNDHFIVNGVKATYYD